ncbi:hypothetical protein Tco_0916136 [Tanacetum coccineum]
MVWSGYVVLMSGKANSIKLNNIPGCLPRSTFVYSEVFKLDFSSASCLFHLMHANVPAFKNVEYKCYWGTYVWRWLLLGVGLGFMQLMIDSMLIVDESIFFSCVPVVYVWGSDSSQLPMLELPGSTRFEQTLYGYFMEREWRCLRLVEYYARKNWAKLGLKRDHDEFPSLIATFIGKPVMLDSYTSSMCNDLWGRSSFARCLIEVNSEADLVDVDTIGIPSLTKDDFTKETIRYLVLLILK